MKKEHWQQLIQLTFPAVAFGTATGFVTAVVITVYKWCAKHAVHLSEEGYHFLREQWYWIPAVVAVLLGLSFFLAFCYKKTPNIRGGGIPTSIGLLRGLISFHWPRNVVGTFFLSLISFLTGVPLGTEGPSVQMGTALGRGTVWATGKRNLAWNRYAMTGGACAGFSVATGAPLSGLIFAIEEAHQRISPMIVIVSATSVVSSMLTAEWLSPLLGVSVSLFPSPTPLVLSIKDAWLPILIGVVFGLFSVLFLNVYQWISRFYKRTLAHIPAAYRVFSVLLLTLILGLCSFSFISTGHELIITLFSDSPALLMLVLILIVRTMLTLSANANGVVGGIFLPLLAIGAVLAALLSGAVQAFGLSTEYHHVVLMLGITACIAGMMKSPLTAIFFGIEALAGGGNLLYVIVTAAITYVITEAFDTTSINDWVLEDRVEHLRGDAPMHTYDMFITVQAGSFAVGKPVREIFWPAKLFVLSVRHPEDQEAAGHTGRGIRAGDVLHVQFTTHDRAQTEQELHEIVGYEENTK